jgi:acyl-CoA thioester hydrolase
MSAPSVEQILASCALVLERPVTWGAMDAYQHVNNTVYFRYFEDARIAYFERADMLGPGGRGSGPDTGGDAGAPVIGPILAETWCRFKAPLYYPDTVHVGTRITEIGEDRFTMEYVVASARLARVAALGGGIIVSYDYAARRKAPMPRAWREVLALPKLAEPPAPAGKGG